MARRRQDPGTLCRDPHRMFEVRGKRPVSGNDRPPVLEGLDVRGPGREHRLDGQDHSCTQERSMSWAPDVGNLGFLVDVTTYAVSHQIPNDPVLRPLHRHHDRGADVPYVVAPDGSLDGGPQRPLRDIQLS